MITFESGAKSTELKPRYDLLSARVMRLWAERMAEGAISHGERNYLHGANDPAFIRDRQNHLFEHVLAYIAGDRTTNHAGAIVANLQILEDCAAQAQPDATGEP